MNSPLWTPADLADVELDLELLDEVPDDVGCGVVDSEVGHGEREVGLGQRVERLLGPATLGVPGMGELETGPGGGQHAGGILPVASDPEPELLDPDGRLQLAVGQRERLEQLGEFGRGVDLAERELGLAQLRADQTGGSRGHLVLPGLQDSAQSALSSMSAAA